MTEDIQILFAIPAHAAAAAEITREAFDGVAVDQAAEKLLGRLAGRPWQEIKAEEVRAQVAETPETCFVAVAAGRLVGYVTTRCQAERAAGFILNLAVERSFRGQGIGRRLIERALEHFRSLGLKQARIETLTTNPVGQHLYPAAGFTEVARQIHYVMKL